MCQEFFIVFCKEKEKKGNIRLRGMVRGPTSDFKNQGFFFENRKFLSTWNCQLFRIPNADKHLGCFGSRNKNWKLRIISMFVTKNV